MSAERPAARRPETAVDKLIRHDVERRSGRDAANRQDSAVNPLVVYDMARDLAKGVLELLDHAPPEWDGGDLGYLVGGLHTDATTLLAALEATP